MNLNKTDIEVAIVMSDAYPLYLRRATYEENIIDAL